MDHSLSHNTPPITDEEDEWGISSIPLLSVWLPRKQEGKKRLDLSGLRFCGIEIG